MANFVRDRSRLELSEFVCPAVEFHDANLSSDLWAGGRGLLYIDNAVAIIIRIVRIVRSRRGPRRAA